MLMLEKQKEKYDKIIELNEGHENNNKKISQEIENFAIQNQLRIDENKRTLEKMD
jgi:hypothetical protein